MWDGFDSTAVDGLLYLKALGAQPVRPSADMFEAFLNQPRPERKGLKAAVKATRSATGSEVLEWMLHVGWLEMIERDGSEHVDITPLGAGVAAAAQADTTEVSVQAESDGPTEEVGTPELEVVTDEPADEAHETYSSVDDTEDEFADHEVSADGSEVPAEAEMAAAG